MVPLFSAKMLLLILHYSSHYLIGFINMWLYIYVTDWLVWQLIVKLACPLVRVSHSICCSVMQCIPYCFSLSFFFFLLRWSFSSSLLSSLIIHLYYFRVLIYSFGTCLGYVTLCCVTICTCCPSRSFLKHCVTNLTASVRTSPLNLI